MDKLLTIAVPTYNAERYLDKCLDSLCIKGDGKLLEVLIINDGSTDLSPDIARKYEYECPETFCLITKENGGHGSAINRGIAEAKGKYFKIVDSDDWVDKKALTELLTFLKKSNSDLIYTNFYHVDERSGKKTVEFKEQFPGVEYRKEYAFDGMGQCEFLKMHGFTVKTEILRRIPLIDEHCFYVDMEYVFFPIPEINTITFLDLFAYYYRIGLPNQSMNIQQMKKNAENFERVLKRLFQYYEQCREQKISEAKRKYMEHVLGRMVASRMKIYLSQPYSRDCRAEMMSFDEYVKKQYPDVYEAVINKAVLCLRHSRYRLYAMAWLAYFFKGRFN